MKHKVALFIIAFLFALPAYGRDKTDVIVMKNGDRFTGEIKGLDAGVLYVSFDYISGTTAIQWSKVDHLESEHLFLVKTENGSVYTGTLKTMPKILGRPAEIEVTESPVHAVVVEHSTVIQMTQTSDKFWHRFNGSINSGLVYSKGNQSTQYQVSTLLNYPRELWAATASFGSTLSSGDNASVSTRNDLSLLGSRQLPKKDWFYLGVADFLQSSSQNIDVQTNLSTGVGRYLKNTNRSVISVFGGGAWQNTKYSVATESTNGFNVGAAMAGTHVEFFKFKRTTFRTNAYVFPALSELGRVNVKIDSSYYLKLFGEFDLNFTFYGNWDNRPPPHFSGSDYGASSGITYNFGNR